MLFEKCVPVTDIKKGQKDIRITLKNNSSIPFNLVSAPHSDNLKYMRDYQLLPDKEYTITILLDNGAKGGDINFEVKNLRVTTTKGLMYSFKV